MDAQDNLVQEKTWLRMNLKQNRLDCITLTNKDASRHGVATSFRQKRSKEGFVAQDRRASFLLCLQRSLQQTLQRQRPPALELHSCKNIDTCISRRDFLFQQRFCCEQMHDQLKIDVRWNENARSTEAASNTPLRKSCITADESCS